MLVRKMKLVPSSPKKLMPKWDQLLDNRLTQADFYDDLLFPRDDFLIAAGVGYPNERVMLCSMNQLQKELKKNGSEEWKIFLQDDGSRVVRLIKAGKTVKEEDSSTTLKGNTKMASTNETRPNTKSGLKKGKHSNIGKTSAPESSVVKTSNEDGSRNVVTVSKMRLRNHRRREKLRRSDSLPQLRAEWERREIKNRSQAEQHFHDCGDFEPFTREELEKISKEKKRYLELRQQQEYGTKSDAGVVHVVKRSSSVGDAYDSDSSSTPSFRTKIIRFSKLKSEGDRSKMSSTESILIADEALIKPTCSDTDGITDKENRITGNEVWTELERNVKFDIDDNGIVSAVNTSKEMNSEDKNKASGEVGSAASVVENVRLTKPWKIGKQIWASMLNRNTLKRTQVGILDREQWKRDVADYVNTPNRRKLKEGYCLKMQNDACVRLSIPKYGPYAKRGDTFVDPKPSQVSEIPKLPRQNDTCDRLSIPKYGPYAIRGDTVIDTKPCQVSEIPKIPRISKNASVFEKGENLIKRKPLTFSENSTPNQESKAQNQRMNTKYRERTSVTDLTHKFFKKFLASQTEIKKSISTTDISGSVSCYRRSNRFKPSIPYDVRQSGGFGDVYTGSKKKTPSRPEFNNRTLQGLFDGPRLFATPCSTRQVLGSTARSQHMTRVMPSRTECCIVSSLPVNRRKGMQRIDFENRRISDRAKRGAKRSRRRIARSL